ncbi:alpha/beta hydrolase [Halocatena salina]|uniref:Dienelactone hydrolase family protein n=1 Tax=Halocatena salina TaxID=2934340 RepID=A0A8U0AAW8_9EURY|nr:dienelactone hydrolase family protein [Halocatena salina]UPM44927.1 dienelactone hydrolase family protein [Halocatena salina]
MDGPHQHQPLATAGATPEDAKAAVLLLHGRGATAQSMLQFAERFTDSVVYLAPQAARNTWYPNSFLAPIEQNEPGLSSGLQAINDVLDEIADAGIGPEHTLLLGFSQGGCLTAEFVARNTQRYGGVAVLSGGLIGPEDTSRDYEGSLSDTPVFLGCSDDDPHVPQERVHESTDVFKDLGGDVTERIYEGMGHTVNEDELRVVTDLLNRLTKDGSE